MKAVYFFFCYFLPPSSCFAGVSVSFFFLSKPSHVEGGEGQAGTLFLSDARLGRFPSSFLSFLSSFPSLFRTPLSPTLLTSSPRVQPTWLWAKINAHMCLQLLFTVLMKVRREKERQMSKIQRLVRWLQTKYSSNRASVYQNNGWIIKWEMLSWLFFRFSLLSAPGAFFWPVMDGARGRLIVESVGAGIKDYYQRIQPGIHSDKHSMTISLHSVLLSSLTLNGESQTRYWLPSQCFIVSVSWLRLLTCLIVSRWIVK